MAILCFFYFVLFVLELLELGEGCLFVCFSFVDGYFLCMYVCVPLARLVPEEARRECQITRNWSYNQL